MVFRGPRGWRRRRWCRRSCARRAAAGPSAAGAAAAAGADEVLRACSRRPRGMERLADCLYVFFCLPLPEPDQYHMPASGRGGWMARRPPGAVLYSYRRSLSLSSDGGGSGSSSSTWMAGSEVEGLYYSDD
ncbi:hypothetical protein D1007_11257 [Hordeum vulgare]|nr:hypothetical protein D1007_11257 [Hordeum vulgare]